MVIRVFDTDRLCKLRLCLELREGKLREALDQRELLHNLAALGLGSRLGSGIYQRFAGNIESCMLLYFARSSGEAFSFKVT